MEKHTRIKLVAGSAAALVVAVALTATVAIAASNALKATDRGQAVIDDAAAELGVEPSALEEALEQGMKNRVQEAVDAGTLTKEQGAELEERIESGDTPFFFEGFGRLHGRGADGGHAHPGGVVGLGTAASYLGLTQDQLHDRLRDGDSLADIAKEEGKSVDGLVQAMVDAAEKELDAAVAAGRLTEERAEMIEARPRGSDHGSRRGRAPSRSVRSRSTVWQRIPSPRRLTAARRPSLLTIATGAEIPSRFWVGYLVRGIASPERVTKERSGEREGDRALASGWARGIPLTLPALLRDQASRSWPSKSRTATRIASGIGTGFRSARSTNTTVSSAVTISCSSGSRYAAH